VLRWADVHPHRARIAASSSHQVAWASVRRARRQGKSNCENGPGHQPRTRGPRGRAERWRARSCGRRRQRRPGRTLRVGTSRREEGPVHPLDGLEGQLGPEAVRFSCQTAGSADQTGFLAARAADAGPRVPRARAPNCRRQFGHERRGFVITRSAAVAVLATSSQRIGPLHFGQLSRSAAKMCANNQAQRWRTALGELSSASPSSSSWSPCAGGARNAVVSSGGSGTTRERNAE